MFFSPFLFSRLGSIEEIEQKCEGIHAKFIGNECFSFRIENSMGNKSTSAAVNWDLIKATDADDSL